MNQSRREFLKKGKRAAGAAVALSVANRSFSDENNKVTIGLIGCGGQGTSLGKTWAGRKDVSLAYVCDADAGRATAMADAAAKISGKKPTIVSDLRKILDDKSVDAVTVATPDHWHGPATILALGAGKHVYVEKPCSHNIREGRLMVEAARKADKIVQVGTQSRSTETIQKAMELLKNGAIGEVLVAKAWNSQLRRNIGHGAPSEPPAGLDYELWQGPAPRAPYQENRLHYGWHWCYDYGTGDMGNDGVHDIDIARWGLGVQTHPTSIAALGGKYFFDDDQQFPDTQYVVFEYPASSAGRPKQLIFEQRIWSPYLQEDYENGNAFYGTEGMLLLGKAKGWRLFGPKNKLKGSGSGRADHVLHQAEFLDAVRNHRRPTADIEIAHLSATLCHLGNIATRVRRNLTFDPKTETILGDESANKLVRREYHPGHWSVPAGV